MVKMPTQEQTYTPVDAAANSDTRLLAYLRASSERRLVSDVVAFAAERLWRQVREALPGVAQPNCVPMDDGGLRFSWIKDDRYVDAEIGADQRYEWFFRDRSADITEDGEATVQDKPSDLVTHLRTLYS